MRLTSHIMRRSIIATRVSIAIAVYCIWAGCLNLAWAQHLTGVSSGIRPVADEEPLLGPALSQANPAVSAHKSDGDSSPDKAPRARPLTPPEPLPRSNLPTVPNNPARPISPGASAPLSPVNPATAPNRPISPAMAPLIASTPPPGTMTLPPLPAKSNGPAVIEEIPAEFAPWWQGPASVPLRSPSYPLRLSLDNVVVGTLQHSHQVRMLADGPVIHRTAICQEQAKFDLRNFAESKFIDTNDPVGNTLTTGGPNRYLDQNAYYSGGIRKRNDLGGLFEVSEKYGFEDSNSVYFVPVPQGTARLTVSYTQPLLNGAGRLYNNNLIVLAQLDAGIAQDQFSKDLQELLVDVHRSYWNLYLQRASLLQRRRLYQEAVDIRNELHARREVDVVASQLARARAAIAMREAAVIRSETAIRNAESRLIATINDPLLLTDKPLELLPAEFPSRDLSKVDLMHSLIEALQYRPEINQAAKEIQQAKVRADVSKNELLPVLNLVLGSYVYGLHGNGDIGAAWVDQFSVGAPSYSAGLTFEMPWGNRAACAKMTQRQLELRQATSSLQSTTAQIRAEVEIAAREVTTAYREMLSKYQATLAEEAQIKFLVERWRLLPGDQQVAGVILEDLLSAQDRRADAEFGMASAQVAYVVAQINLKRTTGTLLLCERISVNETCVDHLPTLLIDKVPAAPADSIPSSPTPVGAGSQPINAPQQPVGNPNLEANRRYPLWWK